MEKHTEGLYDTLHDEKADYAQQGESSQSHFDEEVPPPYIPDVQLPILPSPPENPSSGQKLQKPIAIPATLASVGSPFLRVYPPALYDFKFPKESFLHFLDNLNRVAVKSPPLQVLSVAGNMVGAVHIPIVGALARGAAGLGTMAVSKSRSEQFLKQANKDIFNPRGLKVEVAKIEAVAKLAGIPVLNATGHIDRGTPLLASIEDVTQEHTLSGQQRRLDSLKPWLADLEFTPLPPTDAKNSTLSKLSNWATDREKAKSDRRRMKTSRRVGRQQIRDNRRVHEEYRAEMWKLDQHEEQVRRSETGERLERELAEINRDRQEIEREYQEELGYSGGSSRFRRDQEEQALRKILWLVIRNLDDGAEGLTSQATDTGEQQSHHGR